MKIKKSISILFLFMFIVLLSGCLFKDNKPNIYTRDEIHGETNLTSLVINLNEEEKVGIVTFDDYKSSSSKIKYDHSTKVLDRVVIDEIGIKNKYENKYYFYKIELNEKDNKELVSRVSSFIEKMVEGKQIEEARILGGVTVTGIGIVVTHTLYNGKISAEYMNACAICENGRRVYTGDSSYKIIES